MTFRQVYSDESVLPSGVFHRIPKGGLQFCASNLSSGNTSSRMLQRVTQLAMTRFTPSVDSLKRLSISQPYRFVQCGRPNLNRFPPAHCGSNTESGNVGSSPLKNSANSCFAEVEASIISCRL